MTNFIVLVPILIFFGLLAVATLYADRLTQKEVREAGSAGFASEYFLGGRSLKGAVLAMTLIATYGSVSSFVSGPGIAWQLGLGWVVFAAPQIITGFFIFGVLGKRMALVSRAVGAITVIDLIKKRFASRALAFLCGIALLVFFTAMMTAQFIGGAAIFAEAAGIEVHWGLILFGLLVVFYTSFGGYRAVAWTDAVCAVLMVLGMFMLGASILDAAGGFDVAVRTAAQAGMAQPAGAETELAKSSMLSPTAGGALPVTLLLSAWFLVGFGTVGLPQSAVRCMSYRTTADLHVAMVVGTVVCGILMIGLTTLGFLARGIADLTLGGASTDHLIPRLIATHMSPWAAGVTLIGPLAATMSTVSSLLIAASSAVVQDLLLMLKPAFEEKPRTLCRISQVTTLILGLLSMVLALKPFDLVAWINMAAFGGLELAFLLPLALGLFWRGATAAGAISSIFVGLAVYFGCFLLKPDLAGWHPVVPAFAAAALVFVAVSLAVKEKRENPFAVAFFPKKR